MMIQYFFYYLLSNICLKCIVSRYTILESCGLKFYFRKTKLPYDNSDLFEGDVHI